MVLSSTQGILLDELAASYSGFTRVGREGFAQGSPTNIICVDGLDLHSVIERKWSLQEVLRRKIRRAGETNRAHVPVDELFP